MKEFDPKDFLNEYKRLRKESRIKECIHPNKHECSEKIISAHSIQNNKILKTISDNGKVYMPCPKNDCIFPIQKEYGRKEATVFTGFCGYHDKTVFQPIEDKSFIGSAEQVFLYIYRAFAIEYHKKKEAVRMQQLQNGKYPLNEFLNELANSFMMAVDDFEEEKMIFDKALINHDYSVLTSIIWVFNGFSNFAASGCEGPDLDFEGNRIQNLADTETPIRHIYISAFPEENKTYVIIAWLKQYDNIFKSIQSKLLSLTEEEKRNYVNTTLPFISENIAIKPSSWDKMSDSAKEEFSMIFYGMPELMEMERIKFDRFEQTQYDLFSL